MWSSLLSCWAVATRNIYRQVHHAPAGGQEGKLASEDSQTNTRGHPQNNSHSRQGLREKYRQQQRAAAAAAARPDPIGVGSGGLRRRRRGLLQRLGDLRRPRQAISHTDTFTDTFTVMQDISEASPERLRARKAAAGSIWACRARLMRTGAEGFAVWHPQARSQLPGIHTVPGHVHLSVASMRQQQQQQ